MPKKKKKKKKKKKAESKPKRRDKARSFRDALAKKSRPLSAIELRRRRRGLLASVEALGQLSDWLDDAPELPPQALLPDHLGNAIEALQKLAMCLSGWNVLEQIDNVLTQYGHLLTSTQVQELETAGETLWENLVRAGC